MHRACLHGKRQGAAAAIYTNVSFILFAALLAACPTKNILYIE